jgi:hypothetical protein
VNIDTGSFRAPTDQAARVDEYHSREALLIRTLAAELSGGDGPLASDGVVRYLADAVIEQGRQVTELRASLGIPARGTRERHLRVIEGDRR